MKQILLIILFPFILFGQTQIGTDIDGEAEIDQSGWSVSLSSDGSIVAIGAVGNDGNGGQSGHVRVYENLSGVWTQIGSDIDGEAANDWSGYSVSLSSDGSIVAIGARNNNDNGTASGHVRVYENLSDVWTQIGSDIDGEAIDDHTGFSLSLSSDGSIVAIGAIENDGNGTNSGHVRVYENTAGVWTKIGSDIDGEATNNFSGWSVSLSSDGSIVAIGAVNNNDNGTASGHVRVFENILGVWTKIGNDIDGEAALDKSGFSVSLSSDGSIVVIGAIWNDDNGSDSGHVRVYENLSGVWTKIGDDIDGDAADDHLGSAVSLSSDGSIIAIGASGNDENGLNTGHVRVYKNTAGVWNQVGIDINGEAEVDFSGGAVSLSSDGSIVAIGAISNDGNGPTSGHVRVFDMSSALSSNDLVFSKFSLFPNPTKNQFTIQLQGNLKLQKVNIYNSLGQFISSAQKNIIKTSELSTGIYYVEIVTNQGKATKKIVIK